MTGECVVRHRDWSHSKPEVCDASSSVERRQVRVAWRSSCLPGSTLFIPSPCPARDTPSSARLSRLRNHARSSTRTFRISLFSNLFSLSLPLHPSCSDPPSHLSHKKTVPQPVTKLQVFHSTILHAIHQFILPPLFHILIRKHGGEQVGSVFWIVFLRIVLLELSGFAGAGQVGCKWARRRRWRMCLRA
jgi:hypothetical protein